MVYDGLQSRFSWHGRISFNLVRLYSQHQWQESPRESCSIRQAGRSYHSNFDWWHENPRDRTGWLYCPASLLSPHLRKLGADMCWEVGSKDKKQTPYIFNKDRVVLKIHEKYVFSFLFILLTDVIFRETWTHVSIVRSVNQLLHINTQETETRLKVIF
jgi:hypothetical protein